MQIGRTGCRTGFMQRIHSLCRLHRMTTILLLVLFGMAGRLLEGARGESPT